MGQAHQLRRPPSWDLMRDFIAEGDLLGFAQWLLHGETNEGANDSAAPDDYNPLSGDSSPFNGREYETSSRAAEVFSPEAEDDLDPRMFDRNDESPLHNSLFGTAAIEGDNTTFSFAELGFPAEQYPPTTVKAYIPVAVEAYVPAAVEELPAGGSASEGAFDLFMMIFPEAEIVPYPTPGGSCSFPFLENTRSPFSEVHAHSAFQVGDIAGDDCDFRGREYNSERSALLADAGGFDSYPVDLPSSSHGFCTEDSGFLRPSYLVTEERNSLPGNSMQSHDESDITIEKAYIAEENTD
ncbi:hypothetical protein Taro_044162 [Colocasia esculenta]|uniref:Uncharacterized protein n=1 Tax=Colocasia esculenta TaxID=4460 RepID=A0A843WTV2_COLES|nr:hypothetical protein [Colocasia esculenta]